MSTAVARGPAALALGGAQAIVARFCFYALGYAATVMLARGLGPVEYGIYGVVISVLVWVEQSAQFTVAPAVAKLIPEGDPDGALAGSALVLGTGLFAALLVLMAALAPALGQGLNVRNGSNLLRLAALDLPFFGAYVVSRGICHGRRDFGRTALGELGYSATKTAGIAALLATRLTVAGALVVNVFASAAGLACLLPRTLNGTGRWRLPAASRLVRLAPRFGVYMLALQMIAQLDLWLLASLGSGQAGALGTYVAARTVAIVPSLVLLAVSDVLLPSLSRALAQGDVRLARRYVEATVRFLSVLVPPGILLAFLTGNELMTLLFSSRYAGGGAYLGVLAASGGLFALTALFGAALNAAGRTWPAAGALLLVAPVAVGFNLVLVPAYGEPGAAVSQLLAAVLAAAALGGLVRRRFGAFLDGTRLLRVGAATLALASVAARFTVTGPLLLPFYAGCLALYGGALVLVGELRRDDLRILHSGVRVPVVRGAE